MSSSSAITKLALKGDKGDAPVKGVDYFDGSPGDASLAWPIGSVFTSVVATNPHDLLGFGTWSAIASGRVLVGLDAGDANFDVLEETGGSKTVQASAQTFSGDALATHQHDAVSAGTPAGTVSQPTFTGTQGTTSANSGAAVKVGTSSSNASPTAHTHTLTPAGTVSQPTFSGSALGTHQHAAASAGTPSGTNTPGAATSVVQPYLVVNFWQRTA